MFQYIILHTADPVTVEENGAMLPDRVLQAQWSTLNVMVFISPPKIIPCSNRDLSHPARGTRGYLAGPDRSQRRR